MNMPKLRFVQTCLLISTTILGAGTLSGPVSAQSDPGPRGGSVGAGGPLPGLDQNELKFFTAAQEVFQEINSVSGTIHGTSGGLGPRFNMNSCVGCHAQPAAGGSSPSINPQMAVANTQGATNTISLYDCRTNRCFRMYDCAAGFQDRCYTKQPHLSDPDACIRRWIDRGDRR